jgi:hypothetical protein
VDWDRKLMTRLYLLTPIFLKVAPLSLNWALLLVTNWEAAGLEELEAEGLLDADGLRDRDGEAEGLREADGERDAEADPDGLDDALGLWLELELALGDMEADGDIEVEVEALARMTHVDPVTVPLFALMLSATVVPVPSLKSQLPSRLAEEGLEYRARPSCSAVDSAREYIFRSFAAPLT